MTENQLAIQVPGQTNLVDTDGYSFNQPNAYITAEDGPPAVTGDTGVTASISTSTPSDPPATAAPPTGSGDAGTPTVPGVTLTSFNPALTLQTELVSSGNTTPPAGTSPPADPVVVSPSFTAPGIDPTRMPQITYAGADNAPGETTSAGPSTNMFQLLGNSWGNQMVSDLVSSTADIMSDDTEEDGSSKRNIGLATSLTSLAVNKAFNENITARTNPVSAAGGIGGIPYTGGLGLSGSGTTNAAVNHAFQYLGRNESNGGQAHFTQNQWHRGGYNEAWCADFVSTVYNEVTGGNSPFGFKSSCSDIVGWAKGNGVYNQSRNPSTIKPGDLVMFGAGGGSHVGIVTSVEGGSVHTIEGNSSNMVTQHTYDISSGYINGFVSLS